MQTDLPTDTEVIVEPPGGLGWEDWLQAGVTLSGSLVAAFVVSRLVMHGLRRATGNLGLARFLGRFTGAVIVGFGLVYALTGIGVRIGPLLGVLGVGGLALAFALQDVVENLISSVILQVRGTFRIGDEIVTNEYEGMIEDVNFRSVVLHTFDGVRVVLPASMVLKNPIENHTAYGARRTSLEFGVAFGSDLDSVREVIVSAVGEVDGVLADPAPRAWITGFEDSAIEVTVWFWHGPQRLVEFEVADRVHRRVAATADREGIVLPYPHRVVVLPGSDHD